MGVSKNSGTPKWMVYNGKLYENGWSGGTTIYGNLNWDQMWCWIYTLPKIQIKIASIWVFPYMGIPALSIRHGKDRFYRHYSLFYGFFENLFPSHKKTKQTSQLFTFWRSVGIFGCWYTSILFNVTKKNQKCWIHGAMKNTWSVVFPRSKNAPSQRCHCSSRMHCKWCPWDIPTWVAVRQNPPNSEINFCTYWVWWTSSSNIRLFGGVSCTTVFSQPLSAVVFKSAWFVF